MTTPDFSVPHAGASPEARPPRETQFGERVDAMLVENLRVVARDQFTHGGKPGWFWGGVLALLDAYEEQSAAAPVSARDPLSEAPAAPTPSEPRDERKPPHDDPEFGPDCPTCKRRTLRCPVEGGGWAFVCFNVSSCQDMTVRPAVPLTSGSEGEPPISEEETFAAKHVADGWAWLTADRVTVLLSRFAAERAWWRTALASARAALDAKQGMCVEYEIQRNRAERERDELQSALDEAKRDTERLDWLRQQSAVVAGVEEGNVVLRFVPVGSPGEDSFTTEGDGWSDIFVGSTLNDAIDAARSASPVQEQTPPAPRISDIVREANENARRANVREANQKARRARPRQEGQT